MNNIYLIVGCSGSGKTTIVNSLENKYGLKSIQSYTTRPKRSDDETGHIFISDEEYDKLEDWKKEKGRQNKIEAVGIKEPEVYLGRYLAACNSHAEFITDAETIKVIKEKLSTKLKQNYKLEKYDILKEIGMQAGNICKETMKQNVFSKAHSHDKKQELTIQKDKQHPPVGMGASK